MRFLGELEVVSFLRDHPEQAEPLQAWLGEVKHRDWRSPDALIADFRSVDASRPPLAVFRIGRPTLVIKALFDFRNRVVLLTEIRLDDALTLRSN